MNWMSILGLCLLVLGTIFSFFGTYFNDKQGQDELTAKIQEKNNTIDKINLNNVKLIDQNSSLLSSNDKVSSTNENLIAQNQDMLQKVGKYQSDIEEKNKIIKTLEKEVNNVKKYNYYATLDILSFDKIYGEGISYDTDLSKRMKKILIIDKKAIFVKIEKESLPGINEIIQKYPQFPFGYWAKYQVEKGIGNPDWKIDAKKAAAIFEVTTTIEGHHPSHDQALQVIRQDLASHM